MKKRFLSLLCVLALCLGLLPVTALAAGEIKLFIGGQQITENGCYENRNGTWTKVDGTEPANGQFYYDAATFTLTLNQAEITHNQTVNVAEGYTYEGSVIAFSQTADVSLKIVVSQGTSTITGTGGIRVESTTGNASLSIKGSGSLDVEPKGSNSGITLCSSKNTNLDIDGADVTASSPAQYGVYLISSTDATSTSTITVNNGSLTTGGNGNVGIYYYWSGTSNAGTSSLTVSGNAVVDTRNSQIMAQNKETVVQVGAGSDGNGGIVFNGKSGTVYGDVTLEDNLTIGAGETLTIGDDASLTVPEDVKLTNNGKIDNSGKLTGTIEGDQPPKITTESPLPNGTVGTYYSHTLAASGDNITWSFSNLPQWLTLDNSTGTITGTPDAEGVSTFTVTATNDSGSDSKELILTISKPVPTYTISANADPVGAGTVSGGGSYAAGTSVTLTATPNSGYRFVGWVEGGTTVSTNTSYIFNADKNRSLTAQFDRISSGGGDSDPTYSITLPSRVTGGELKLSRRYAEKGETVTLTAVPDEGYELDTLTVTDSKGNEIDLTDQGGNEYTFKMPAGRVTIDVTFRKTGTPLPFADVGETYWAYDEIAWAYENGYMSGTSATAFTPGGTVTRQQVWMILARMAGANPTDMAAAKAWAVANGISDGTSPGSPVTRQQLAALLYRYAVLYGYDVSVGENTNILSFTDVGQLSEYAIPAMQWAVGAGIINGTGDGSTLTPQGDSTRAQLAVMLYRFMGSM